MSDDPGKEIGPIDADSHQVAAFDEGNQAMWGRVVSIISRRLVAKRMLMHSLLIDFGNETIPRMRTVLKRYR